MSEFLAAGEEQMLRESLERAEEARAEAVAEVRSFALVVSISFF